MRRKHKRPRPAVFLPVQRSSEAADAGDRRSRIEDYGPAGSGRRHYEAPRLERLYRCSDCGTLFRSRVRLALHIVGNLGSDIS